jgi:hypothetical protein
MREAETPVQNMLDILNKTNGCAIVLGQASSPISVYRRDRMQLPMRLKIKSEDRHRCDREFFPFSTVSDFSGFGGGGL